MSLTRGIDGLFKTSVNEDLSIISEELSTTEEPPISFNLSTRGIQQVNQSEEKPIPITKSNVQSHVATGSFSENYGNQELNNVNKSSEIVKVLSEDAKETAWLTSDHDGSLSSSSTNTKYFINYEGKLSVRTQTKKGAVEKFKEASRKFEIVTSILSEMLSKIDSSSESSKETKLMQTVSSAFSSGTIHSSRYVSIKNVIEEQKEKKRQVKIFQEKPGTIDQTVPKMCSIVKNLGLPITLIKTQPYLDIRAVYDRVLTEKDNVSGLMHSIDQERIKTSDEVDVGDVIQPLEEMHVLENIKATTKSPFDLNWCFGFNADIPILNLSKSNEFVVLFANSQFTAIYDFHKESMRFMEGHKNPVSSIASDLQGSLLVTADCGRDSRIIIWDSRPCVVQVLQNMHPRGSVLVGLSGDGTSLVTVSPPPQQQVQLWLWQQDNSRPAAEKVFNDSYGEIKKLTMNPSFAGEFALTFETAIIFAHFVKKETAEGLGDLLIDTHQIHITKLGMYTDTTFLLDQNAAALSSTSTGFVVIWIRDERSQNKKVHEKHIRLHLTCITHITTVDNLVVVVTESGNISFYDANLTVLFFHKLKGLGPLKSISFDLCPQETAGLCDHKSHNSCAVSWCENTKQMVDATLQTRPFSCRHFVVSTTDGRMGYYNMSNGRFRSLLYPSHDIYTAIDTAPHRNYLCAGTSSGNVLLIDTTDHKLKVLQNIASPENQCQAVSQLSYSPSGFLLACGMYSGAVWLLDPLLLTPSLMSPLPLFPSTYCISHLAFSPESDFLAIADTGYCVSVYSVTEPPVLLGLYQAHFKPLQDIFFSYNNQEQVLQLCTLGADRNIAVFNILYESSGSSVVFHHVYRVEQTAVPLCITPYPACDSLYLIVNSEMKFKLLDSQTLQCCKTFQAPDFGSDEIIYLEKLNEHYLVFATKRHIGLQMLPIDGNPYKTLGYLASTTPIISCKVHSSREYLFVISENCSAINMWKIQQLAVEEWCKQGGEGLAPFLSLLEPGREQEIRDLFLVGQFSQQGEWPGVVRELGLSVATSQVISVLQALGFFPSQYQINNIKLEVQGSSSTLNQPVTFDELVRLYINHKPSHDLNLGKLRRAFHLLRGVNSYDTSDSELVFPSTTLVDMLTVTGEEINFEKLYSELYILMVGKTDTDDELQRKLSVSLPFMPKILSFRSFIKDVLGFQDFGSSVFSEE